MTDEISVNTEFDPPDLLQRLQRYPGKLDAEMQLAMQKSMFHIQGSVPPYPPAPKNSWYKRTGTLGRSLVTGHPMNVRKFEKIGPNGYHGQFGTNVEYAPRVIGEGTQEYPWKRYWWHMGTVKSKAEKGVIKIFENALNKLAAWLDGKG